MVSVAEAGLFNVPVMVTIICEVTLEVVTVNVPLIWPAAMGTLGDMKLATDGALLDSWTTAGPVGA